jgi:hypothetical protein
MPNTRFGIAEFQTTQARNSWTCLILMNSKFQHHNAPLIIPLRGNGDVLDIVVNQNIRVSDVIVSDILDSDHQPVVFHILDHVKIRNVSEPIEKFRLDSELISPKIEINSGVVSVQVTARHCKV